MAQSCIRNLVAAFLPILVASISLCLQFLQLPGLVDLTLSSSSVLRDPQPARQALVNLPAEIPFRMSLCPSRIPNFYLAAFYPLVASGPCFLVVSRMLPLMALWISNLVFFSSDLQTALLKLYLQCDCAAHHVNKLTKHKNWVAQLCYMPRSCCVLVTF